MPATAPTLKYRYIATFTDGTTFEQPEDDASRLRPVEKSSKFDFLEHARTRTLSEIRLTGDGFEATARSDGWFLVNGRLHAPGSPLPSGCEWIEGDPAQGAYFRLVDRFFAQPEPDQPPKEVGRRVRFCFGVKHEPGARNFLSVS